MEESKQDFLVFMSQGKGDIPWSEVAEMFNFSTGEAARSFWKRTKKKNKEKTVSSLDTVTSDLGLMQDVWGVKEIWSKHREVNHPVNKGEKLSLYETTAKLYPKDKSFDFREEFKSFVDSYTNDLKPVKATAHKNTDNIPNALILSLTDLHLDKKSYFEETEEHGDIDIIKSRAINACFDLVDRAKAAHPLSKIIIIGGNDYFHANSAANTTQKGTPLDVDGRWHQSFKEGLTLMTTIIDYCAEVAPTEYYTVLGNHSPEREWYLSVALEAFYRKSDNVFIETVNKSRKYFSFGTTAFMLTHEVGNKTKDLPLIFATERPEMFANSKYRFVLTGHLHRKHETQFVSTNENYGIVFKILPSLSSSDKWHHDNFFINNQKSCIALVINKEYGDIAELIYNE